MLKAMLKKENVKLVKEAKDWQDAVTISLRTLVADGYVEEIYIKNIVDNTIKYGPYFILMPEVALIHGRPDQGVLGKQLAVTLLERPVEFSEKGHPVRLMIALAATDSESHLETMKHIASILMKESLIKSILASKSEAELYRFFTESTNEAEDCNI